MTDEVVEEYCNDCSAVAEKTTSLLLLLSMVVAWWCFRRRKGEKLPYPCVKFK